MTHALLWQSLLVTCLIVICIAGPSYCSTVTTPDRWPVNKSSLDAMIRLRYCNSGACPYSASWLAHKDLFRRVRWRLNSTKMEQASLILMQQTKDIDIFQMSDPDAYYVNHLSEYEHLLRKKTHNLTMTLAMEAAMSGAAAQGECATLPMYRGDALPGFLALMAFYGGVPPDVDQHHRVRSVGEGNSLASRVVKAKQGIATACSLLRYFETVVVAVSSVADVNAISTELASYPASSSILRSSIIVLHFNISRGSNLPFYLLSWAQLQLYCIRSSTWEDRSRTTAELACNNFAPLFVSKVYAALPFDVPLSIGRRNISYIYYTEADQLLRFDDMTTLKSLAFVSNRTTVVLGRRRNKLAGSGARALPPERYSEGLARGRGCGHESHFFMRWPATTGVYALT